MGMAGFKYVSPRSGAGGGITWRWKACFYSFGSDMGFVLVGCVDWGFGFLIPDYSINCDYL
jgi:hypothetical protein